jgi:hypothetical protein
MEAYQALQTSDKLTAVLHILKRNLKKYQRDLLLNPDNQFALSNLEWICEEILDLPANLDLWLPVKTPKGYSYTRTQKK